MELLMKLSLVLTAYLQIVRSQPNLAAIWGLGALGDLGESGMGGFPGMGGMNAPSGSGNCPYQAHPNKFKFTQMVNNRLMTQECAPGTMFVLSKCSCDNIPSGGVGATMPGSNPRMEVGLGGGGNSLLNALVSQLQGGGGQSSNLQPPPVRNRSPPMSNHLSGTRPRVSSGIRPDQNTGSSGRNSLSMGPSSPGIQYNPDPSSGLTSVVDPSVLQNILPPEILQILSATSGNRAPGSPGPTPVSPRRSTSGRQPSPSPTNSPKVNVDSLAASGMPPEVLQMLQRSMGPPGSATNNKPSQPGRRITPTGSASPRMVATPTRATKTSGPRRTPQSIPIPTPTRRSQMKPPSGPRQDPLAALLGGMQASRTQPTRRTNKQNSDPLAALMAGIGGGNSRPSSPQVGIGGDPMAALLAGLGGGSGGMGGSNGGALAALLGGSSSGSASPSRPGGALDVTSLTGNLNVAALLGETPGRGLVQNVDMTALFNAQGQMGAGGGIGALSGINNVDILKLQQLDRQGVIDISDLTPAGLAAANAHFG
ncbi:hypothetical protein ACF0H5_019016 [Mactra antiquata]